MCTCATCAFHRLSESTLSDAWTSETKFWLWGFFRSWMQPMHVRELLENASLGDMAFMHKCPIRQGDLLTCCDIYLPSKLAAVG